MGTIIRVDFKNKSWVAFYESAPAEPLQGVQAPPSSTATMVKSVPWNCNPYKDYDMSALLEESYRFGSYLSSLGGYITPEICRWGIPLYEAMAVRAHTPEFKAHAADVAYQLSEQLRLFDTGPGPKGA